ncbi:NAD-dependent epimerase/dehydratase family protein [Mesonia sp. K7]|uniref:NAD-dependent epimerase/dehydratase family protein n=1 Tax=Mesonia sp. K7 TaxID=2218606 RepID=UPI001313F6C2|nr:NAD-dependent epimerase/dehydratase family protein [Mesonia sp. K7]
MILVTGATGLVGRHLIAELSKSKIAFKAGFRNTAKIEEVRQFLFAYFDGFTEENWQTIHWVSCDINDIPELENAFKNITHVYHCAGYISYDVSEKNYQKLRKINIEGTANVVNMALKFSVEKLVHVSSIAALGSAPKNQQITEESARDENSLTDNYAITKFGAEMEVWRASQEGLNVAIVNPGVIIGAGNWDVGSCKIFTKVNKGLKFTIPLTTGFVAVEDVVTALIELMNSNIKNERFILVSENLSFEEVITQIATNLNKPIPTKVIRPWMVKIGWLVQYVGRKIFGTRQQIQKSAIKSAFGQSFYNNEKAKTVLGIDFIPIEKSILRTAHFFKQTNSF